jgi:hypothetical protein
MSTKKLSNQKVEIPISSFAESQDTDAVKSGMPGKAQRIDNEIAQELEKKSQEFVK